MSKKVEILQLQITGGAIHRKDIVSFFKSKRWKQKSQDRYVTRYASTNFHLNESGEDINVNIWIAGAFGVIVPYENAIIGRIDQKGFNEIVDDFKSHIMNKNLDVKESTDLIEGLNQESYLTIGILSAIVLGCIMYIFLWNQSYLYPCLPKPAMVTGITTD